EQGVVGGHALVGVEVLELDLVLLDGQWQSHLAVAGPVEHGLLEAAAEEAELPDQFAAVEAEGVEGADADEVGGGALAEAGALDEVEEGAVLTASGALFFDAAPAGFADFLDVAEADADGATLDALGFFDRAEGVADVDVRAAHAEVVADGVV